jgi:multiple sugar transport system permease protein
MIVRDSGRTRLATGTLAAVEPRHVRWAQAFDRQFAYVLVLPTLALLLLVVFFPLAYSLYLSLTDFNLMQPTWQFVGLHNYVRVLSDPYALQAFENTIVFTVASVCLETTLGLGMALLLQRNLRGAGLIRTLFMIPMMTAPILSGFQFRWFFNDQFGLLNNMLVALGIIHAPIAWLAQGDLPMLAVIIASVWRSTPFVMLVLLAGLLALPREPFEAAEVDGANTVQRFIYVTLPLLLPLILLILSMRILDSARTFDLIQLMTQGGPARRTDVLMTYIYRAGWVSFDLGYASAFSYLTVFLQMALLAIQVRFVWKVRNAR